MGGVLFWAWRSHAHTTAAAPAALLRFYAEFFGGLDCAIIGRKL
jgi:hypothetical protein